MHGGVDHKSSLGRLHQTEDAVVRRVRAVRIARVAGSVDGITYHGVRRSTRCVRTRGGDRGGMRVKFAFRFVSLLRK